MKNNMMSRKDFLKRLPVGVLGLFAVISSVSHLEPVAAAQSTTVRDNLAGGGASTMGGDGGSIIVSTTAPNNKRALWIDTSKGGRGITKYWTGSAWSATASIWDS